MSTHTTTMKSRAGSMTHFAEGVVEGFAAVRANLAARLERRRVYGELSRMTDRDLSDIGITRSEIPQVAGFSAFPALSPTNLR